MAFRKSSWSAGSNCVEVDATPFRTSTRCTDTEFCVEVGADNFRKSRRSGANGQCVEVGGGPVVQVRDTKQQDSPERTVLQFGGVEWGAFLQRVRGGDFW